MKIIYIILSLVALTACGKEKVFPSEFAGQWSTKIDGAEQRINVTKEGIWTFEGMPAHVKLQLRILDKKEDGYILETTNTLNPKPKQYTFNRIENGKWIVTMLNEDLTTMKGVPDDRWTPLNRN
jgi:hypothetical protein